jgi:hypothetical protein
VDTIEANCNEIKPYDREEHNIGFIVTCADLTELLEPAKEAFHHDAPFMLFVIILPAVFAFALWRNDRMKAHGILDCSKSEQSITHFISDRRVEDIEI